MIVYHKNNEIDREQWDNCIKNLPVQNHMHIHGISILWLRAGKLLWMMIMIQFFRFPASAGLEYNMLQHLLSCSSLEHFPRISLNQRQLWNFSIICLKFTSLLTCVWTENSYSWIQGD